MHDIFDSPVLVPFGYDLNIFDDLIGCNVFVNPPYKFWGKRLEITYKNQVNDLSLGALRELINEDYTGIIRKSKYYNFLKHTFNKGTAELIDSLYQIEYNDEKQKDLLLYMLTKIIEPMMDDEYKCKKIKIDLEILNDYLDPIFWTLNNIRRTKLVKINIINEPINSHKFPTIYDSIPRVMRMYDRNYLGFIEMFTGEKENLVSYENVLSSSVKNNLLHGGNIMIENCPREMEEKVISILHDNKMECLSEKHWRNQEIKVIKITKGIMKYW